MFSSSKGAAAAAKQIPEKPRERGPDSVAMVTDVLGKCLKKTVEVQVKATHLICALAMDPSRLPVFIQNRS